MISSTFTPLLISKNKLNGRSFGKITVRHRGSGIASRISKNFNLNYLSNFNYLLTRLFNFSRYNLVVNNTFFFSKNLNKLVFLNFKIYSNYSVFKNYLTNYKHLLPTFTLFSSSFFTYYINKELFNEDNELDLLSFSPYRTNFFNVTNGCYISNLTAIRFNQHSTVMYSRSFFSYSRFIRKIGFYSYVKLASTKIIVFSTFSSFNFYGYGEKIRSPKFFYINVNKAGFNRNLGFRPSVRGVAMNPIDHPHGGRTGESRPSVSPWAILTKGYPTVRKKVAPFRQLFLQFLIYKKNVSSYFFIFKPFSETLLITQLV